MRICEVNKKIGLKTTDSFDKLLITAALGLNIDYDKDILEIRSYRHPLIPIYAYDPKTLRLEKEPVGPYITILFKSDNTEALEEAQHSKYFVDWKTLGKTIKVYFKYPEQLLK